ncbi:MAG TPA: hypothetical protein VFF24_09725 [Acidimicrobiia bacterium]|nr:hypothetical protein [Acidimicrobiia bacterium]
MSTAAASEAIVAAAQQHLAAEDPGHEWEVTAAYRWWGPYSVVLQRLGPGDQPGVEIEAGDPGPHPEGWTHLGTISAHGALAFAADHDDGGRGKRHRAEKFGVLDRQAGWAALHGG